MLQANSAPQESNLRRRVLRRSLLLEAIGIGLLVTACMVDWDPPDDPGVPPPRPFFALLGLMIFLSGLALKHDRGTGRNAR